MDRVFIKHIQIGADVFPVLFASGRLQNVSELALGPQPVHHVDIMLDPPEHKGTHHRLSGLENNVQGLFPRPFLTA